MLRRRSIRLRILVLVLVPVVALIGLYAVVIDLTLNSFLTLRQASSVQTEITTPVSNLQAELTIERGLALQYMANPAHAGLSVLLAQTRRTDGVARLFLAAAASPAVSGAGGDELHAIDVWRADLGTLDQLRASVTKLAVTRLDALNAYSNIISDGNTVTDQAILPLLTGTVGIQANDIIDIEKSAQTVAEESDLLRADLAAPTFPGADLQLFGQLVVLHQEIWDQTLPELDPIYQSYFKSMIPAAAASGLAAVENDIVINGVPRDKQATLRTWDAAIRAYAGGLQGALAESGATLQTAAESQARVNGLRLALTGGLGLLAIIVAVAVAIFVSRGLVRQLNDLRLSALELSGHRLPNAIQRLRAGEDVDVDAEVAEFESSPDEIGQVRQAFNTVQRTAIAAAIDENRIRRGVNDVFRNLARRNQSLLTRQLQLLDAMERRIDEPEELADLFRIDHLTTRMRRHAEGLLIVAGGSSGRSWREPVPVVDVMRAAIAEVEDYTRIRVMSRTGSSIAGHAVADVIHLLAELLENATMFSPANTPVRVDGDLVARGMAVEIEDRGLGMREDQIAEINRKLADPPLFDLSGSDQLGLFIAGQLATRHDIKITLRSSPFGGTTAVVLIPRSLVVLAEGSDDLFAVAGVRELGGRPIPQLLSAQPDAEPRTSVPSSVSFTDFGAAPLSAPQPVAPAVADHQVELAPSPVAELTASRWLTPQASYQQPSVSQPDTSAWSVAQPGPARWPASPDDRVAPLPTRQPAAAQPAWSDNGPTEETVAFEADVMPAQGDPGELPVRVRQASLAPQLRGQFAPARPDQEESPADLSPEAARSTMAALQHGWQRGRSLPPPTSYDFATSAEPLSDYGAPGSDEQPAGGSQ